MEAPQFNLTNPDCFVHGDPHPYFKHLRAHAPVSRIVSSSGLRYWAVVKYRDALTVYRDPRTFSSEAPISVSDNAAFSQGRGKMLIMTDSPRHLKLRNLFKWSFTPMAVRRWQDTMPTVSNSMKGVNAMCLTRPGCAGSIAPTPFTISLRPWNETVGSDQLASSVNRSPHTSRRKSSSNCPYSAIKRATS